MLACGYHIFNYGKAPANTDEFLSYPSLNLKGLTDKDKAILISSQFLRQPALVQAKQKQGKLKDSISSATIDQAAP